MIFLTVGSTFPFDRLIQAVDEIVSRGRIREDIVAQIGDGTYEPRHIRYRRFLPKPEYDDQVNQATMLIAHAGAGTIAMALSQQKPLLVLPRLKRFGESVNDHQIATAREFERLGHVLVAWDVQEIDAKIEALRHFAPRRRTADPQALARRIGRFLEALRA